MTTTTNARQAGSTASEPQPSRSGVDAGRLVYMPLRPVAPVSTVRVLEPATTPTSLVGRDADSANGYAAPVSGSYSRVTHIAEVTTADGGRDDRC